MFGDAPVVRRCGFLRGQRRARLLEQRLVDALAEGKLGDDDVAGGLEQIHEACAARLVQCALIVHSSSRRSAGSQAAAPASAATHAKKRRRYIFIGSSPIVATVFGCGSVQWTDAISSLSFALGAAYEKLFR